MERVKILKVVYAVWLRANDFHDIQGDAGPGRPAGTLACTTIVARLQGVDSSTKQTP